MKSLLLLSILSAFLFARENPFDSPSIRIKTKTDYIPLVTIKKAKKEIVKAKPIVKTIKKEEAKPDPIIIKEEPKKFLLPPIIIDEIPEVVECCIKKEKVKKPKVKKIKRKKKKVQKQKTIYKNYFLKITTDKKSIKIYTKDCLLKKSVFKNPKRVVLDFKRVQHFKTKTVKIYNSHIKAVKVGSHNCTYRITIKEDKKTNLRVKKTSYGYLIY
jgi:hypothetical protein